MQQIAPTEFVTVDEMPQETSEDVYVFPTSYSQQRLWFLDQFEPNSPYYNIPSAVRIEGPLDVEALERGIGEIVQRHESLRTTFAAVEEEPVQVIHPRMEIPLTRIDLQALNAEAQEAETTRLALEEARQPFNLAQGPLLRVTLLVRGPEDHVLLLTMHHIISDGWSMSVFIRELSILYDAFTHGESSPLPELPIQYADFAEWQRNWLQGDVLEQHLDYWRRQIGSNPPVLRLPTDRPRPAVYTSNGAKERHSLPKDLAEGLQALSQQEGVTLFMTLLAAFQTLLYRYTGQDDICVGTAVANRNRAEIEPIIGLFINTLVMRTDLSPSNGQPPTFRDLLQRVRAVALDAYAHQDLPFEKLVVELNPERDMSHTALFQVMFILQNTAVGETGVRTHDLTITPLPIDKKTSNFDLTLMMAETSDGLNAILEYNTDLFDAATIQRMLAQFEVLIQGIVADPDRSIATLPLLPAAERQTLLTDWTDTTAAYDLDRCVHHLIEQEAERQPHAVAVVCEGAQLTYAELNRRANQLAHHLQKQGVGPDVLVGICVERSLEMIVAVLGVMKAGGAYVPLDPNYPQDRLAYMLQDAEASVVLTLARCLDRLPESDATVICLDSGWPAIAQAPETPPLCQTTPDNLVYTIYTSGSTGNPKGVMITHRNLVNAYLAWEDAYALRQTATAHLQMASFSFDVFAGDLVRALCSGAKLVICPFELLMTPEKLHDLMVREQVDAAEFVPAVLRTLIQHLDETEQSLAFVNLLVAGSDSWYMAEYREFLDFCGPQTRLINSFGLTETTIDSTYFEEESEESEGKKETKETRGAEEATKPPATRHSPLATRVVPIGRPFANQRLYLLDEHLQPVPIGVYGEIYIGGASLARGFRNRPDLTAEKYVPDPFSSEPGARLYRTGDLARYLPDGNVEFAGRIDNQVKIRGLRIELGEVEAALGQHPAIREVAAIVREDEPGRQLLVAYVVPDAGIDPDHSELRRFLLERLPGYMVPSAFVPMTELPLTPNGKIDRRSLPVPELPDRTQDDDYVAPRTPTEEILAGIWSRVLDVGQVSVHDNFFAIGGHSLLATQVNSRLRDSFQVDLPLRHIFEFPTIAGLAQRVEMARRVGDGLQMSPIQPIPRHRDLPLSFAQERLWFLDQLAPGSPSYNIAEAYRLSGPLDVDVLQRSLNEIVRRHEVLRTTFATVNARPVQIIAPDLQLDLPVVELRHLPPEEREAEARRLAAEEAQKPFDLARGPLLRVTLLRLDEDEHVVLLTIHHIISDDWSSFVYLREIAMLYSAFAAGQPSPLPDLEIQYVDYAHWQREFLQGDVLESQLAYWKEQLSGAPPLLELPTDRPRPPIQTARGASQSFVLPPEITAALKELSTEEGATLFMTMLAAFQTLLSRYSGQDDISVGTPVSNRNRSELEGLIGFFVNTLVMRTDLADDPPFRQLVGRVREVALGAYAHQDLPFEKLVDELRPERNMSRTPLFQAMLVMQNIPRQAPELGDQGLQMRSFKMESKIAKFDLTLFVVEADGQLRGSLNYNTDLFDDDTITRMLRHFQNLLAGVATDPDQPISAVPLLSETERDQLLIEWSGTRGETPLDGATPLSDRFIHQRFETQVEETPNAVAVAYQDQDLTYRELNERANQLAYHLRKQGVGPEVLVGICMERSLEMMVALLGVLKAGGAYVPLDPAYPDERLAYMIEDSGIGVILTQQSVASRLAFDAFGLGPSSFVPLDADWEQIASEPTYNPDVTLSPDNLAYVIYTSGSTGRPKGTLIAHRGLTNYLNWCLSAYPIEEGRGSVVHSTIAFDATITALYSPLLVGRTVRMLPETLELDELTEQLRQDGNFSLVKITPAHLDLLSHQLSPDEAANLTRAFVIGGENLLGEQVRFWQENAPQTHLFNEYGPTENVVGCIVYDARDAGPIPGSVPIGTPIPNTRAYVLDEHLQPVPIGVAGELYLGGVAVARGYRNRPDLTAEKFVPDPFSEEPGARLYRTGDLARYRADGTMEFLGRIDHQVKIRGYRVECGEVEAVLSQHDGVREAVVLAREDVPGDRRLVAYWVPTSADDTPTQTELRERLKQTLPDYMVPSFFVELEALPLTLNGKVDRRALPAPDGERPELETVFVAPRTPTEEQVAAIWMEVLGVEQVGVHDQFFELGGHSLLATQIISRVQQTFEIELPLRYMFERPTVAGLAESIETIRWAAQGAEMASDGDDEDREEGEL